MFKKLKAFAINGKWHRILQLLANRASGMVLQFLSVWLMARLAGVETVGGYAFYTAWMLVLAALTGLGTPLHAMRTVSVLAHQGHFREVRQYLWSMSRAILALGALVIGLTWFIRPEWIGLDAELWSLSRTAAFASLAFMVLRIFSEAMKGLNAPNQAIFWESIWLPGALCVFIGWAAWRGIPMNANMVALSNIAIMTMAVIGMAHQTLQLTRGLSAPKIETIPATIAHPIVPKNPLMDSSILPLWGSNLAGMLFQNMPLLVIPYVANAQGIGEFSVAYRYINVAISLLMVVASIYGPQFAREYADRNVVGLRKALGTTQRLSILLLGPLLLSYMLIPQWLMGLFGASFVSGDKLLFAMAAGQLIYASTGLVGYMMNMIHREKIELAIMLFSTVVMAILMWALGSELGAYGIAIGFAMGMGFKNLASLVAVRHYLKLIGPRSIH